MNQEPSHANTHDAKLVPLFLAQLSSMCKTCTLCKKIFIGETGRRLAERFRERLRDVEKNNTDASKPVVRHFNLRNHSHNNMTICGLSLHQGNTESRKEFEQKFIFQLGTLSPHEVNERFSFHLFIRKFMWPYFHQWQSSSTLSYKPTTPHNSSLRSGEGLTLETSAF